MKIQVFHGLRPTGRRIKGLECPRAVEVEGGTRKVHKVAWNQSREGGGSERGELLLTSQ